VRHALRKTPVMDYVKRKRRAERMAEIGRAGLPTGRVHFIDHHTAHASAAYHGCPWNEEDVLVLTADGEGDDVSASVRVGRSGRLSAPLATVHASDSLGGIYSVVTFLQGMVPMEHEYKLMGLAPYAPGAGAEKSYRQFEGVLKFDPARGLSWHRARGVPPTPFSDEFFRKRLRNHRFDWVAAGLQRFTEEHLCAWAAQAVRATGIRYLALGGGVFMNVKANQRISEMAEVEGLFIFPSCGDETNAMGAAFAVEATAAAKAGSATRIPGVDHVYWGPSPMEHEIVAALEPLRHRGYRIERHDDIEVTVADMLVEGEVVARVKGPMAFGARALGDRSILADPARHDVVRIINDMIKCRDFWMPFAPSILAEKSCLYVRNPKKIDAPFMIITFDTTERAHELVAGIQQSDRTARPQFVHRDRNADYHRLISRFFERTGRAAVLNTSFNIHGEPIAASARDAVDVLQRSGLRHLALGNYLVSKV
jgi:carbamoyltransferase